LADRSQMPFTDATIHEIQRCSDLIPMNVPHRVTRDTRFRGFLIPKVGKTTPNPPKIASETGPKPDPFGIPSHFWDPLTPPPRAGKRLCLGEGLARAELFLFLTSLLQRLRPQPRGEREELSTEPLESGFANIPPRFLMRMVPR
ncbi:CP2F1 protein, partial [Bombycilla garrulus]|nr:CP2F1 protein [Bombycilla garrulus]